MIITLKRILLAEDSDRDAELTLNALAQHNLVSEIERVRDGAEALDYLYRRGQFVASAQEGIIVYGRDRKY